MQVAQEAHAQRRRREALSEQSDLAELLEATNVRRRAAGLPERTVQELREELGSEPPSEL